MIKYGKSFSDIIDFKKSFFEGDAELLKDNIKISEILLSQPIREKCKNCGNKLERVTDFIKQNIPYELCRHCNQLNSFYEDTEAFANSIYVEEVTDYAKTYSAESKKIWLERMQKIYLPKAEFLKKILDTEGISGEVSITDLGAGSGYFVKALQEVGYKNSKGYEVSQNQVNLSGTMLEGKTVEKIELNQLTEVVKQTKSEVISMIGVLEHLTNPREILKEIAQNENIKFIYFSVPLFSYSVFFELLVQTHFNRHLSGGHTHLYTNESIDYFCNEFDFSIIGKWQFGVDAMDLYRLNLNRLKSLMSAKMIEVYQEKMNAVIDDIQLIFDKNEFSSEIHVVVKKNYL